MSEMVYVSLRTDKPGTVNSFTVMMKANSRPAPVLRLVPDRDSRNNSVRPTARLRAVSDFQFSIRDRPCRHPSRLSVSRWNRLFECPAFGKLGLAAILHSTGGFANSRRISSFSDKLRFQCVYVRLSRKTFLPGLRRTRPLIPPCYQEFLITVIILTFQLSRMDIFYY